MDTATSVSSRWLYGPAPDLLLGCGLGYGLVFFALIFTGEGIMSVFPLALTPLVALFLSIPHYGATLLRVYEKPEDRIRYTFFSVYLTALVWLWFVVGVYHNYIGSMLITLYFFWSPWHYMGQNYGLSLMFLGRRGVRIPGTTKRLLHGSFLLSFLLTITEILSVVPGLPDGDLASYHMLVPDLPPVGRDAVYLVLGTAYAGTTLWVVWSMLQHGKLADLVPTLLLMFTQALWFLVPLLAIRLEFWQSAVPLSKDHAAYAFFWVAIGHAVQYLWITSYFARRKNQEACGRFFFKALASGAIVWVLPAFVFAPTLLGQNSYGAGLAILVAAAVNIHHFILDGAIWKLRDGRIARILLREVDGNALTGSGTATMVRYAVGALGLVCVVVHYAGMTSAISYKRAWKQQDLSVMVTRSEQLHWLGRSEAVHRKQIDWLRGRQATLNN